MKKAALFLTAGLILAGPVELVSPASAANRSDCKVIVQELKRQGAKNATATYLGSKIAWRESGCQSICTSDHDDLSCSRFGNNFRTASLRAGWQRLCGTSDFTALRNLRVDVKCALAAFKAHGKNPWRKR